MTKLKEVALGVGLATAVATIPASAEGISKVSDSTKSSLQDLVTQCDLNKDNKVDKLDELNCKEKAIENRIAKLDDIGFKNLGKDEKILYLNLLDEITSIQNEIQQIMRRDEDRRLREMVDKLGG